MGKSNYEGTKFLIGEDGEIDLSKFNLLKTEDLDENRKDTFDSDEWVKVAEGRINKEFISDSNYGKG